MVQNRSFVALVLAASSRTWYLQVRRYCLLGSQKTDHINTRLLSAMIWLKSQMILFIASTVVLFPVLLGRFLHSSLAPTFRGRSWVLSWVDIPDGAAVLAGRGVPALGRHALRHADGRDAARLRAHDAARAALPGLDGGVQQHLRHLSRHSTPSHAYLAVLPCRPGTG